MKEIYEKHEFNTTEQQFGADYADKAHLQESFNKDIVQRFAEKIAMLFNQGRYGTEPMTIADFACGHGKPTYDLLWRQYC